MGMTIEEKKRTVPLLQRSRVHVLAGQYWSIINVRGFYQLVFSTVNLFHTFTSHPSSTSLYTCPHRQEESSHPSPSRVKLAWQRTTKASPTTKLTSRVRDRGISPSESAFQSHRKHIAECRRLESYRASCLAPATVPRRVVSRLPASLPDSKDSQDGCR
jgi:hypothetical protein